jgi:hypothetical protein
MIMTSTTVCFDRVAGYYKSAARTITRGIYGCDGLSRDRDFVRPGTDERTERTTGTDQAIKCRWQLDEVPLLVEFGSSG